MNIFTKKREYSIITNMKVVSAVRDFADKHCAEGCEVDTHVHGCLLEDNNLVTITFKTDMEEALLFSDLVDEFFKNYRFALRHQALHLRRPTLHHEVLRVCRCSPLSFDLFHHF